MIESLIVGAAASINTRSDFERWSRRANSFRLRILQLLAAYLLGAVPIYIAVFSYLVLSFSNPYSPSVKQAWQQTSIWLAAIPAFLIFGPIVTSVWWYVLAAGLAAYKDALQRLTNESRVCMACEQVSMYEDNYLNPRSDHQTDLVPHMNVIKEAGITHVLCDACLAEVNAMDSDGAV